MTIHVTGHAIQRFQERVANLPADEVRAALSTPAIERAAAFGAPYVKLGSGHRVVIEGDHVITVLERGHSLGCMDPNTVRTSRATHHPRRG